MNDSPQIARIILHVGDIEQGTQFYSTLLGVQGKAVGGGRVYFECGPVILGILNPAEGGTEPKPIPDILYFTVQNVEQVFERAKKLNCLDPQDVHGEPAGNIAKRPWGERSFYAVDPWNNGLCFLEEKTLFRGRR